MLGENVVFVNAAGCFSLLSCYPFTPFMSSWMYTAMACAPAGAQGVRDALDVLQAKGKRKPEEDMKVVVLTGDGSANDIGLQATSAAIHRGLDFYYLCYDNEAFGNTGFQMSSASPFGSRTGTSMPVGIHPVGTEQQKKNLFEIWRAHKPPYMATVSPSHPMDLARKFEKAGNFHGPKLFISIAPCPPGWGIDTAQSANLGELAVDTGIWPLKEAISGEVVHTYKPKFKPVEEYLKIQRRFQHLFSPVRQDEAINNIQQTIDDYWKDAKFAER
ncbi:MAG: thiamine pyrophosphate-dependent enzyme [Nitrospirota bacterium]|nr:thiamine pyrophosphate-dependent enzyme [Nitrospirota bacterium]